MVTLVQPNLAQVSLEICTHFHIDLFTTPYPLHTAVIAGVDTNANSASISSSSDRIAPLVIEEFPKKYETLTSNNKGLRFDVCYQDFAKEAVTKALSDAQIPYTELQQAGYVYGDTTCGQRALYEVGMIAIQVYNVNNNKKIIK
uniref:Thiolase N-terminal domain-containing protein n=1 Tax=Glossina pallidipes TaxID=7398 RepID=A0A1A9ZN91_GLOPL